MSLLRNTKPLVVDPDLARMIGLNEALVLQQIHYWITINEKKGVNNIAGRTWTYNSLPDWANEFPFWSEATIKRTLKALRDMGLVVTGNYNKRPGDRTLWYSIDYIKLEEFEKLFSSDEEFFQVFLDTVLHPSGQNDHMVKMTRPSGQNDPTKGGASGQNDLTVTRDFFTEISTEIYCIVSLAQNCEIFRHWWGKFCEGIPDNPELRGNAFRQLCGFVEKYPVSVDQITHAIREAVQRDHPGHMAYLAGILENMIRHRYIDTEKPVSIQVDELVKKRMVSIREYYQHYVVNHDAGTIQYVLRFLDEDDTEYVMRVLRGIEEDIRRQCGMRYRFADISPPVKEVPA